MRSVGSEPAIKSVRLLGGVHAVAVDGSAIDLPSASQRRLLAILALHSPRRLRSEWLADVLGIAPCALRMLVSRLRTAIGAAVLQTASTGYSVVTDVDVLHHHRDHVRLLSSRVTGDDGRLSASLAHHLLSPDRSPAARLRR